MLTRSVSYHNTLKQVPRGLTEKARFAECRRQFFHAKDKIHFLSGETFFA